MGASCCSPSPHFVSFVGMLLRREKKWGLQRDNRSHISHAQADIPGSLCPNRADGIFKRSSDLARSLKSEGAEIESKPKTLLFLSSALVSNESPKRGAGDVRGTKWKGSVLSKPLHRDHSQFRHL